MCVREREREGADGDGREFKAESKRFFERRATLQHWHPNSVFLTAKGLFVTLTSAGRLLEEAEGGFG
jgi:hypothetical protein